jgi:hypothetical protein
LRPVLDLTAQLADRETRLLTLIRFINEHGALSHVRSRYITIELIVNLSHFLFDFSSLKRAANGWLLMRANCTPLQTFGHIIIAHHGTRFAISNIALA